MGGPPPAIPGVDGAPRREALREEPPLAAGADQVQDGVEDGAQVGRGPAHPLGPRQEGLDDVIIFGGGIIPDEDIPRLKQLGVSEVFTPGARMEEIIQFIRKNAHQASV